MLFPRLLQILACLLFSFFSQLLPALRFTITRMNFSVLVFILYFMPMARREHQRKHKKQKHEVSHIPITQEIQIKYILRRQILCRYIVFNTIAIYGNRDNAKRGTEMRVSTRGSFNPANMLRLLISQTSACHFLSDTRM